MAVGTDKATATNSALATSMAARRIDRSPLQNARRSYKKLLANSVSIETPTRTE
jgi:hypothetical protein